ncbi:MAG TPA: hypothetical protein PKA88_23545 [Polyangiaceae bacterium]|nr:hypothetical protein [Polyangiaceae bacterium]
MTADTLDTGSRFRVWLAGATGLVAMLTTLVGVVNYARWPVADMGGIVARAMILVVIATQLVPLFGFVAAWAFRKPRSSVARSVYWLWFAFALLALALGGIGAMAFFR